MLHKGLCSDLHRERLNTRDRAPLCDCILRRRARAATLAYYNTAIALRTQNDMFSRRWRSHGSEQQQD